MQTELPTLKDTSQGFKKNMHLWYIDIYPVGILSACSQDEGLDSKEVSFKGMWHASVVHLPFLPADTVVADRTKKVIAVAVIGMNRSIRVTPKPEKRLLPI